MNPDSAEATNDRLQHALERLQSEPRSEERRTTNRRRNTTPIFTEFMPERRQCDDRRSSERRA
jgi:hypothetical protein